MPVWLQWTLALLALVIMAPLIAFGGKRVGRTVKGGSMLAMALLGFGTFFDPPAKHVIEAISEAEDEDSEPAGDPPET